MQNHSLASLVRLLIVVVVLPIALAAVAPIALVAVALWIVSASVRALARLIEPRHLTRDQLVQFDPILGWKWRPNLRTHHQVVDFYRLTIGADGWPGGIAIEDADVVVFGDSFAAGYGVDAGHSYARIARAARVKPVAVVGYAMVQELICMRQQARALRGKRVVWLVYLGNDLYDNLTPDLRGYRKPFVRETGSSWEIVTAHVSETAWPIVTPDRMDGTNHFSRLADLCSDTFLSRRAFAAADFLIGEAADLCRQSGAELTVVTIPEYHQLTSDGCARLSTISEARASFDPARPDRAIAASCRRRRVDFVAGTSFLDASCYKLNDCHWTERGHARVAAMMDQWYARGTRTPAAIEQPVVAIAQH
jgi:hypothetical protein